MPLRLLNALLPRNQPRIHFYDEPFFPGLKGHKRILIHLKFRSDNCIEFSLSRRNPVKTLKNIALKAVSSNVSHSERIYNMDIPDDHLKMSLMQDFHNDWIKWLAINTLYLLKLVHQAASSDTDLAVLSKLEDVERIADSVSSSATLGFKASLIEVLTNLMWEHLEHQSIVEELEGLHTEYAAPPYRVYRLPQLLVPPPLDRCTKLVYY